MQQTYEQLSATILNDPTQSYWLKDAVQALSKRDCVDAAHDVETLRLLCNLRMDDVVSTGMRFRPQTR